MYKVEGFQNLGVPEVRKVLLRFPAEPTFASFVIPLCAGQQLELTASTRTCNPKLMPHAR